jgi:creatinine amidohydrolase
MHLAERPWTDVRDTNTDLALLPVGSTEQHGPHAPLGVDVMSAEAIADGAAERYDGEVVVAPSIPVGVAEEHRAFDGSLWVSEDTLRAYVGDVLRSLAHHGFDRVVVVNGHGGNAGALFEVCSRVTRDGDCYAVPFVWFEAVDSDLDLGHAGPVETSLVLALRPDLIREDRYPEAAAGAGEREGVFAAGTNLAFDYDEFSEAGNLQDPTPASSDEGERLLDASIEACLDVLRAVSERDR